MLSTKTLLLLAFVVVLLAGHANAFGAGDIASISRIKGQNWRHGDIEDMLKTIAFIKGHKWTSMTIKRVYFGNWLRDYSQALDVGTLKGTNAAIIRVLVWILSFMSFGYATAEFEVTDERLGVYRPEEHIDNPKDYADNQDARQYDPRLRPPVMPEELAIDPRTGMKNYIANEDGPWATSVGYIKHSFARSIHFGRVYTNGAGGSKGKEADLCEALRCLGQGLHTLEDFGAHTNYVELVLREMGFLNVFPHVGTATQIYLGGKNVFPLVTGTFGGVDFLHSVLGEATDHITQSEVDEMNKALGDAVAQTSRGGRSAEQQVQGVTSLLSKIPNTGHLCQEAVNLQRDSNAQAARNARGANEDAGYGDVGTHGADQANPQVFAPPPKVDAQANPQYFAPPPKVDAQANPQYFAPPPKADAQANPQYFAPPPKVDAPTNPQYFAPPPTVDAQATIAKIYPILAFRDKVVRAMSSAISMIPGLEPLIERIQERVTLFIMALLAPYIQPLINVATEQLKLGSSSVIDSSGKHQFEPWTDPQCSNPTHSLLSKDHFSNILNSPAGQVASVILQYCAPRILYAWENPSVPLDQVLDDISQVFHHPAMRNQQSELHRNMFAAVERWVQTLPQRGANLDTLLSAESVKEGKNHTGVQNPAIHGTSAASTDTKIFGLGSHGKVSDGPFAMVSNSGSHQGDGGAHSAEATTALASAVSSAVQQSQDQAPMSAAPPSDQGSSYYQGGQLPPPPPRPDSQPPPYPTDYTPYDPSKYSTAYSQGYTEMDQGPPHTYSQQQSYSQQQPYPSQPQDQQHQQHQQQQQQQQQQSYDGQHEYGYTGAPNSATATGYYALHPPPVATYSAHHQQQQQQQQEVSEVHGDTPQNVGQGQGQGQGQDQRQRGGYARY